MCRWQNDLLSGNSEQKCGTWDGGSGSGHCQYSWPSFFSTTESGSKVNSNTAQNFTSLQRKLRGSSWIWWIHQQPSCFHCSLLGKGAGVESCEYFLENWFPISVTGFVCRKKCCFCKLKPWSRRSSSSRRDQWQSTLWTMTRRSFVRLAPTFWETTLQQTTREHLRNWLFPLHLWAISGNLSGGSTSQKQIIDLRLVSVKVRYPEGLEEMVHGFKLCATARLFLQDFLPHVDAGIFLDNDIVVMDDLASLWDRFEIFTTETAMAMAPVEAHYGVRMVGILRITKNKFSTLALN